jgi:hypothetical protein
MQEVLLVPKYLNKLLEKAIISICSTYISVGGPAFVERSHMMHSYTGYPDSIHLRQQ